MAKKAQDNRQSSFIQSCMPIIGGMGIIRLRLKPKDGHFPELLELSYQCVRCVG